VIDPDVVREVLGVARSRGAGFAELYAEERSSTVMRLDDGRVEEVVAGGDRGAGIRVFHGESQAYAYTNRLDAASLREAAVAAASAGRDGGGTTTVAALAATPVVRQPVRIAGADVPRDRKVGWLREADEAARAFDPAVRQVLVAYLESLQHVLVANSDGRWSEEERPRIRLVAQVVASRDDLLQTGFDGPGALAGLEFIKSHPPAAVAERAARMAVAMLGGRPAPAGQMPVVLGPGGGGILFHEACGHGLEVDHVQKDASVFKGRLGESFASPLVNGVDDGTVPAEWGTNAFDDEGAPTQRTVLFEKGTLVGMLYDEVRARHDGVPSTGNGRRQSYAYLPIPRMTNSSILPGDSSADEIVRDTSSGLYAKALGGGQVNPATGDFVFGVAEGYLIEKGELTTPVRGANLIGNGPQILAGIDAVADDYEFRHGICGKEGQGVPVANGSPTLRIAEMTVGGTDA
jgi:TldD protein